MPIKDRFESLNKIHATFHIDYPMIYDKVKDQWRCTCHAATFNKTCKHLQLFKKEEEDRKEMYL